MNFKCGIPFLALIVSEIEFRRFLDAWKPSEADKGFYFSSVCANLGFLKVFGCVLKQF